MARIDVEWWLTQAKRDLKMAEILLREGYYEGSAYHSQQAAEKALKALVISRGGWHLTHSCKFLLDNLKELGLDVDNLYDQAMEIDRHYLTSRYPNSASAPPYELYNRRKAEELLEAARQILRFAEEKINEGHG